MHDTLPYQLLADIVLTLHASVVLFVVGGLALIIIGNLRAWRWVNGLWFRIAHLGAIVFIVAQSWLGRLCPLTTWEMRLRGQAHVPTYQGSFIEHWLARLLYYEAPPWAFLLAYTLFALLVVAVWWRFPPRIGKR